MGRSLSKKQDVPKKKESKTIVRGMLNREEKKKEIMDLFDILPDEDKISIFEELGVGGTTIDSKYYTCYMCGRLKNKTMFYRSTDSKIKTGVSRICKSCCENIVYNVDKNGEKKPLEKNKLYEVLEYLDKPYLDNVFDNAVMESKGLKTGRDDWWKTYIVNISRIKKYDTLRFRDSDNNTTRLQDNGVSNRLNLNRNDENDVNLELDESYKLNKKDVIKFVSYDPFENYPIETDKPLLYSQLVNFLDEETKNDGMKLAATVQIVKKLNQAEKLNDQIDALISDIDNMESNQPLINKMADTSSKLMNVANNLAKDNGISVNHNNNKSKGANTLSGKMKELRAIGLRSAEINTFDVGTCQGMMQVAEISERARHMQIGYDENIATEIKDIKVELVEILTKERDEAVERARRLLVENRDLKDYMVEKGLLNSNYEVIE